MNKYPTRYRRSTYVDLWKMYLVNVVPLNGGSYKIGCFPLVGSVPLYTLCTDTMLGISTLRQVA